MGDIFSYHLQKRKLLCRILEINLAQDIFCENCGKTESEIRNDRDLDKEDVVEWHIHHEDEDGRTEIDYSGWDCLRVHQEDRRKGKNLKVVDRACHIAIHENQDLSDVHLDH